MFLNRFALLTSLTVLALGSTALFAFDSSAALPGENVVAFDDSATESDLEELDMAAATWTHYGCIQLGSDCLDVFRDSKGRLWVCLACGTTQNPNPGSCRRLTAAEIANALWCA